ncbi:MAG: ABC transporter permease [Bryobacterales bacterium]|nr:ABC transporter permease [Bryobacterales bacterium]
MNWFSSLRNRLRALRHRSTLDSDLEAELAHHVEMKQRALTREGHADPERAAHLALGNSTAWRESTRAQWGFVRLETLAMDTAYALRRLRKDRLFSLIALITLTLGIGATTAIFSLLNGLLWRPLPVASPHELVRLRLTNLPPTYRQWTNGREVKATEQRSISYPMYEALRRHQQVFAEMFGSGGGGMFHVEVENVPYRFPVRTVTGSLFPALGITAQAGRLLHDDDDRPGGPGGWHAVISDKLWTRIFERSPRAIGGAIRIDGVPFTIAGIAPAGFQGVNPGVDSDVWIPLSSLEAISPSYQWRDNRGSYVLQPLARLRPGVTIEQAQKHLDSITRTVLDDSKELGLRAEDERHFLAMKLNLLPAPSGFSHVALSFGDGLWVLLAAVGLVLLIAATNLTNLFLARSASRAHDFAVRVSLGAPAWRIRREMLLESALLAVGGTAGGVLLAYWLSAALQTAVSGRFQTVVVDTSPDLRMLAFLAATLAAVVLVAGLVPAFSAARVDPQQVLRGSTGASRALPLRRVLIVLQTALSLTLLCGAGLMLASLNRLTRESAGFETANTFFAFPDLFNAGIPRERTARAYESLLSAMRATPGIEAVAWTRSVPLGGGFSMFTVEVPGRKDLDPKQRSVFWHSVSEGYFAAAGLPMLAGSDLPPKQAAQRNVAILSENAARRFFGSASAAIGQRLKPGNMDWMEIIGVVADAKYHSVREAPPLTLYLSCWRDAAPGMTLAVRHRGPREPALSALQSVLRQEAGRMPYLEVRTMEGNIAEALTMERLVTWVLAGFAVFAMLICATGLAGLLAYLVEQRRKELGIRLALGAEPSRIRRDIQWQGLVLTLMGLSAGAVLSYALRKSLDTYLYGVAPTDPWIWVLALVVLILTALAAAAIPASRAARIDPAAMLRES